MEELKPLTRDEIEKKIEIFYNALKPYVKDSGFFMSVMLGQVGIESYWGTSTLAKKANNFTGHKFKAPFSNVRPNDYFIKDAGEEVDGKKVVYEDEKWRKYKDIDDWAKHHADWLTQSDWYKNHYKDAINAKTPEAQLKALTNVYATDSNYATSVMKVINEYGLKKYDKEQVSEVKEKGEDTRMAKLRTPIKKHTQVNMGGQIGKIEYIVIHFVGASGQALANANYFYNVMRSASAHVFIDPNVTYEVVPENRVAWHVG